MRSKGGLLKTARGNEFWWISFGHGTENIVMIPGLGDGLITVKGKAFLGNTLFPKLASSYRMTVISRKNNLEIYSDTRSMARDQAEAMEELGIRKAHVIGISQGGMIAQHLAADNPQLIDKLILVATCPRSNPMIEGNIMRWFDMANFLDYSGLITDMNEKAHPEKYMKKLRPLIPLISLFGRPLSYERFMIQGKACLSQDASKRLSGITSPTLIMGGELDETLGPEPSRELNRAIPGSKLYMYPDHGHALYEDAKDFCDRIDSFIQLGTFIPG